MNNNLDIHIHFLQSTFLAIASLFSALLLYLNISEEMFGIFTCLIVVDFVTGIWAAKAIHESITSNKAKYGLISKFSLLLIPIVLAAAAKAVGQDASNFFNWGVGLLVFSEAYSVISNIVVIRTGKALPEWDAIALLAKAIRERFVK